MSSKLNLNTNNIRRIFKDRKSGTEEFFKFFSVLIPVIERQGKLYLLYEVRAKHMDRQPGEICFPGGELEEGETTQECALRETWEEIGIPHDMISVVAKLDTIYTYSNFAMYCYLGIVEEEALADLKLNRDEVESVFLVDMEWLIEHEPKVYPVEVIPSPPEDFPYNEVTGGKPYNWRRGKAPVPVYEETEGKVIWGLTARITKRFIDIVKNYI